MSAVSSRKLALEVLMDWERSQTYAADLMERAVQQHQLASRDAALLQSLVLGVLRNVDLLDIWLDRVCDNKHLEDSVHWLLRLGIAQLLLLEMPSHAVVNETVNLAGKARGLVNAVLRRVDRERSTLLGRMDRLAVAERTSHPEWLVERWIRQYGRQAAERLCEWNQQPAETYVRRNQLHPEASSTELPPGLVPTPHPEFFRADVLPREWLTTGKCYAQDPSTALACELLAPRPGETVLDACAAPGGKAAYLAQLMQNQGRLLAADTSPRRIQRMEENLKRLRVSIATCLKVDWSKPAVSSWSAGPVDRILLDAPCSNTGVMRRRVDVRWRLEKGVFATMAALQSALLGHLAPLLRPGGSLVYSTCSIDDEENEQVVKAFTAAHPAFELVETRTSLPWRDGHDGAFAALLLKKPA